MGRIYFKELPLFHLYDSDLTGTQKLLMTLLLVNQFDIYDLSCLRRCARRTWPPIWRS